MTSGAVAADNRARFPLAVLDITHKMARQYADDAFIIGYRFAGGDGGPGDPLDDTMYLLEKLAARGVDYLHFSVGATPRPSIVDTQRSDAADREALRDAL